MRDNILRPARPELGCENLTVRPCPPLPSPCPLPPPPPLPTHGIRALMTVRPPPLPPPFPPTQCPRATMTDRLCPLPSSCSGPVHACHLYSRLFDSRLELQLPTPLLSRPTDVPSKVHMCPRCSFDGAILHLLFFRKTLYNTSC